MPHLRFGAPALALLTTLSACGALYAFPSCDPTEHAKSLSERIDFTEARGREEFAIVGAALAHVHRRGQGYGSGASSAVYARMRERGLQGVQLNTFVYQEDNQSLELSWNDATLTQDDLLAEIRAARAAGLEVMLKPHVWVNGWDGPSRGQWRNQIRHAEPDARARWFAAYRRFLLTQLDVAIAGEAEYFVVGTELAQLTRHEDDWRRLIADLRAHRRSAGSEGGAQAADARYAGKLGYSCEDWNAKHIRFWDALDFIGVNFYPKYSENIARREAGGAGDDSEAAAAVGASAASASAAQPSADELAQVYAQRLGELYGIAERYERPLHLTELGFPAHDRALLEPHAWPQAGDEPRPDLQSRGFRAMRQAFALQGRPTGLWFWKYVTTLESYERRSYPTGFILQGKPAEMELQEIIRAGR